MSGSEVAKQKVGLARVLYEALTKEHHVAGTGVVLEAAKESPRKRCNPRVLCSHISNSEIWVTIKSRGKDQQIRITASSEQLEWVVPAIMSSVPQHVRVRVKNK